MEIPPSCLHYPKEMPCSLQEYGHEQHLGYSYHWHEVLGLFAFSKRCLEWLLYFLFSENSLGHKMAFLLMLPLVIVFVAGNPTRPYPISIF